MDDQSILSRIEALVEEEHSLIAREQGDAVREEALEADRRRREEVSVELDRCWDLLRQRRARREFDEDPAETAARPASEVEDYLQ